MPKFELISLADATLQSGTGKRAELAREYLSYIEQLGPDQAGRLEPEEGESTATVRRRLGTAARLAGKALVIKRVGDQVYFWVGEKSAARRRRGRPQKEPTSEE